MKKFVVLLMLVAGCAAHPMETESENECLRIGAEMAETIKGLRMVSHDPDPARVDMLMEQAADFDECMSDYAPN